MGNSFSKMRKNNFYITVELPRSNKSTKCTLIKEHTHNDETYYIFKPKKSLQIKNNRIIKLFIYIDNYPIEHFIIPLSIEDAVIHIENGVHMYQLSKTNNNHLSTLFIKINSNKLYDVTYTKHSSFEFTVHGGIV